MRATITNRHERRLAAPAETVAPSLDSLGGPDGRLWPRRAWPPITIDRPLRVGVHGGHGPIRYQLTAYEPGRMLHFTFRPSLNLDPRGHHRFEIRSAADSECVLRHELALVSPSPAVAALWHLVIAPLHDALIEDLLDNATAAANVASDPQPEHRHRRHSHRTPWSLRARLTRVAVLPLLSVFTSAGIGASDSGCGHAPSDGINRI